MDVIIRTTTPDGIRAAWELAFGTRLTYLHRPNHVEFSTISHHALPGDAIQRSTTMGLFDGLLGGVIGAGMAGVVNDVIEKHGGVQGIISQFQANGLGPTVQSWVGTGANMAISSDQVHQALGSEQMQALAAKLGIPEGELAAKLS